MSIGNKQAFPRTETEEPTGFGPVLRNGPAGITYREWLIGMALSGETVTDSRPTRSAGLLAIQAADAVLEILENEGRDVG